VRAHVLNHVPYETSGSIGEWLEARRATVTETGFYADTRLPSLAGIDLVVIMGGPMSVNDETDFPWLCGEKQFLRDAIMKGVPTLGICLGSQLMANALGARVTRNRQPEHGWFDVEGIDGGPTCFRFPDRFTTFHSHGETWELPKGATLLARSATCDHQAFQFGRRAIGLQCHLESTPSSAGAIVEACANEFPDGPTVQQTERLRVVGPDAYTESRRLMAGVLEYLVST